MSEVLNWSYRTAEIPDGGLRETRAASDAERAALTSALEVLSCDALTCEFRIRATGGGRFRVAGDLTAHLAQSCVVTLEPLVQTVEGRFDVAFWPPDEVPGSAEDEVEALSASEIEPIEHGRIDVGRIVYETLSAAVDPYPRKEGAEFDAAALGARAAAEVSPFAALKKLKDQD
jgi:uncharacterized metal-binding protein YceD (DUF177 family)